MLEQDLELDDSAAVPGVMDGLAAMTGGKSLVPEDLPGLIQRLTKDTESLVVRTESKQTLWDTWAFFFLLVGLLGTEWFSVSDGAWFRPCLAPPDGGGTKKIWKKSLP